MQIQSVEEPALSVIFSFAVPQAILNLLLTCSQWQRVVMKYRDIWDTMLRYYHLYDGVCVPFNGLDDISVVQLCCMAYCNARQNFLSWPKKILCKIDTAQPVASTSGGIYAEADRRVVFQSAGTPVEIKHFHPHIVRTSNCVLSYLPASSALYMSPIEQEGGQPLPPTLIHDFGQIQHSHEVHVYTVDPSLAWHSSSATVPPAGETTVYPLAIDAETHHSDGTVMEAAVLACAQAETPSLRDTIKVPSCTQLMIAVCQLQPMTGTIDFHKVLLAKFCLPPQYGNDISSAYLKPSPHLTDPCDTNFDSLVMEEESPTAVPPPPLVITSLRCTSSTVYVLLSGHILVSIDIHTGRLKVISSAGRPPTVQPPSSQPTAVPSPTAHSSWDEDLSESTLEGTMTSSSSSGTDGSSDVATGLTVLPDFPPPPSKTTKLTPESTIRSSFSRRYPTSYSSHHQQQQQPKDVSPIITFLTREAAKRQTITRTRMGSEDAETQTPHQHQQQPDFSVDSMFSRLPSQHDPEDWWIGPGGGSSSGGSLRPRHFDFRMAGSRSCKRASTADGNPTDLVLYDMDLQSNADVIDWSSLLRGPTIPPEVADFSVYCTSLSPDRDVIIVLGVPRGLLILNDTTKQVLNTITLPDNCITVSNVLCTKWGISWMTTNDSLYGFVPIQWDFYSGGKFHRRLEAKEDLWVGPTFDFSSPSSSQMHHSQTFVAFRSKTQLYVCKFELDVNTLLLSDSLAESTTPAPSNTVYALLTATGSGVTVVNPQRSSLLLHSPIKVDLKILIGVVFLWQMKNQRGGEVDHQLAVLKTVETDHGVITYRLKTVTSLLQDIRHCSIGTHGVRCKFQRIKYELDNLQSLMLDRNQPCTSAAATAMKARLDSADNLMDELQEEHHYVLTPTEMQHLQMQRNCVGYLLEGRMTFNSGE